MAIILPDNQRKIVVSAILTKAGREKLAAGLDQFKIVKFAVADDQVDYTLDELENLSDSSFTYPVLQPVADGDLMMNYKLYTSLAVNAGSNILVQLVIDGLSQQTQNVISAIAGSQAVYSPSSSGYFGGTENYTFGLSFLKGEMPFESVHYYLDGWHEVTTMAGPSTISIPNAKRIKFIKKAISNESTFRMTVHGNVTGVRGQYNFKVIPSANTTTQGVK